MKTDFGLSRCLASTKAVDPSNILSFVYAYVYTWSIYIFYSFPLLYYVYGVVKIIDGIILDKCSDVSPLWTFYERAPIRRRLPEHRKYLLEIRQNFHRTYVLRHATHIINNGDAVWNFQSMYVHTCLHSSHDGEEDTVWKQSIEGPKVGIQETVWSSQRRGKGSILSSGKWAARLSSRLEVRLLPYIIKSRYSVALLSPR